MSFQCVSADETSLVSLPDLFRQSRAANSGKFLDHRDKPGDDNADNVYFFLSQTLAHTEGLAFQK